MSIVLQHQFEDLEVLQDRFRVSLSFAGTKERITIPYIALTSFADPGMKFGLKFNIMTDNNLLEELAEELEDEGFLADLENLTLEEELDSNDIKKTTAAKKGKDKSKKNTKSENVVTLDAFRKKDEH